MGFPHSEHIQIRAIDYQNFHQLIELDGAKIRQLFEIKKYGGNETFAKNICIYIKKIRNFIKSLSVAILYLLKKHQEDMVKNGKSN